MTRSVVALRDFTIGENPGTAVAKNATLDLPDNQAMDFKAVDLVRFAVPETPATTATIVQPDDPHPLPDAPTPADAA